MENIKIDLLPGLFPAELLEYFEITGFEELCLISNKTQFFIIDFSEVNELPNGYSSIDYESKGFIEAGMVQDFPIRGKGVFLRIKKRRWRHKQTKQIIKRDFSFIADGSKFTSELSDFLKDAGGYATRYHGEYSELFFG